MILDWKKSRTSTGLGEHIGHLVKDVANLRVVVALQTDRPGLDAS